MDFVAFRYRCREQYIKMKSELEIYVYEKKVQIYNAIQNSKGNS